MPSIYSIGANSLYPNLSQHTTLLSLTPLLQKL